MLLSNSAALYRAQH